MEYSKGLEGVIAGETAISNVEGDEGRLTYRGYAVEELVNRDYLDVVWLVLFGDFPDPGERKEIGDFMLREGNLAEYELRMIKNLPTNTHPMKVLQAMIPVLSLDPEREMVLVSSETEADKVKLQDAEIQRGLKVIAKITSILIAYKKHQSGEEIEHLTSGQGYLEDFLVNFTGKEVPAKHFDVLKLIQILQMEHSFNAGTFASMVVSSTLASVESVMSAGVGALSGILHGGADEAALKEAERVGGPDKAEAYVDELLNNKGRLMGMGHREYRVVDPRSVILKPVAEDLCAKGEQAHAYKTLLAIELAFNRAMKAKGRDVWANLEFYKGVALEAIGIPKTYFTSVFVMARSVGWLAHFLESRNDNRIYRPKAWYTGPELRSLDS